MVEQSPFGPPRKPPAPRRTGRRRGPTLRLVGEGGSGDGGDPPGGGGWGGGSGDMAERPVVHIIAGQRHAAIDEAEEFLVERDPDLFQRGLEVVRVAPEEMTGGNGRKVWTLRIIPVDVEHMRVRFTKSVDLQRFDKRSEDWVSCDCPKDFAAAYLKQPGIWRLALLRSVTTTPTLRPDGSICEQPGYDPATEVYYDPRGVAFPAVPANPSRAEAFAALDRLKCLLGTFDFVDQASMSVALSAILTALVRSALDAAPLHGFTAPVAGSGKSKLVDIASILATGDFAAVMVLGDREEETEKRLGAALIGGDQIIALDNVERVLRGQLLCQIVTQPMLNPRILGKSLNLRTPNVATIFATGNNLRVGSDMARRTILCRLDPGVERPELREFETPDPCFTAFADRPQLVVAALTILRAFYLAGMPRDIPPLGSFGDWSRWVRDPLIWLGEADPVQTMEDVRRDDPRLSALAAVLEQWSIALGCDANFSARQIADEAAATAMSGGFRWAEFREALLTIAGDSGAVSARRLGRWLGEVKGRALNGFRIDPAPLLHGVAMWRLVRLQSSKLGG